MNNKNKKEKIKDDMIINFLKIVEKELEYVNKFATITEKLRICRDFTTYEIFSLIDRKNERYLNSKSIQVYMKKNGYQIDDYESEDIIYRLHKVDKDKV